MTEPSTLPALSGPLDRQRIAEQIAAQLGERGSEESEALLRRLAAGLDAVSDAALERFARRVQTTGENWGYHPPDPVARALSREVQDVVFEPGSALEGGEFLVSLPERPVIFLANHLSFADANVFEHLLARAGLEPIAARLAVVVGPKVFTRTLRRLASLCFGSIKIPQSSSRASGEALMSPREVARLALETLRVAHERLAAGDRLFVCVEGTRSRSGHMQRALGGVGRYLEVPEAVLFPVGIFGSERLVPIAEVESMHRTRVGARVGPGIEVEKLRARCGRNRTLLMDAVGFLIAAELPVEYRGVYAGGEPALEPARAIARDVAAGVSG